MFKLKRKTLLIIIISLSILGGILYFIKLLNTPRVEDPLTIILSPHFDDGVLSLGGLMAKHERKVVVATFFTKKPEKVMNTEWDKISGFSNSNEEFIIRNKENENSLRALNTIIKNYNYVDFQYRKENKDKEITAGITQNIENLIIIYPNRELFIYGPATFGPSITHPDHQIVHNAFMNVWKKHKEKNVHFMIYEDFPYIYQFSVHNPDGLKTHLEKIENIKLKEYPIELTEKQLSEKISDVYLYKSQIKAFLSFNEDIKSLAQKFYKERCKNTLPGAYACEVVYATP